MAYARLSPNAIGAVITYLEMAERPSPPSVASDLRLERLPRPKGDRYRDLFKKVGQTWLWFERLTLTNRELRLLIQDPAVEIYVVADRSGEEVGMVELDFRQKPICNLAYVGLLPELTGRGHGAWLLGRALELAWDRPIEKVTVNTCTLDHPAALKSYLRAGFKVRERAVGTFVDPRLRGLLPIDAAPQIPMVVCSSSAGETAAKDNSAD
jgi:GNAT superfamily N-acetyltransferase